MDKLKSYLVSNKAKSLYWQMANLGVLFFAGFVTQTGMYPTILLPALNQLTKYINQKYL